MSRKRKATNYKSKQLKTLEDGLINNGIAISDHEKKKKWSPHDLKTITPLNTPQQTMFRSYFSGNHIIANGSPQRKIIIVRSAVATRDVGALPGDLNEKLEPFEVPYMDILHFLTGNPKAYTSMKKSGIINFISTSYIRSLTWDDAVIVVDEVQNMNFGEINSVITRVGEDSRLIIVGDQIQTDLYKTHRDKSGMEHFLNVTTQMKEFEEIVFTKNDVVRSPFVKSWITAMEEYVGID
jgi:phosphate starvation-inducible protein PhoH